MHRAKNLIQFMRNVTFISVCKFQETVMSYFLDAGIFCWLCRGLTEHNFTTFIFPKDGMMLSVNFCLLSPFV